MILVAMLATTFIFFFKFVVDTGILVVAKINLQNAADLAAYSGAASQARLLNQIGFLNYDMHQAYKKFLFKYYAIGSFSQASYPKLNGASKKRLYVPTQGNTTPDYKVPVVCIDYQNMSGNPNVPATNNCAQNGVTAIPKPNGISPMSGVGTIYKKFVDNLNKARGNNACPMFGGDNMATLLNWLYNGDPSNKALEDAIRDLQASGQTGQNIAQQKKIFDLMRGVSAGMGLVPRLLINKMRIDTLTDYLNTRPNKVNISEIDSLSSSSDPAEHERTIEAFYSAYHTLGPYLFDSSTIQLEELAPGGGVYAEIDTIRKSFTAWFLDAIDNGSGGCTFNPTAADVDNIPIGVSKNPSIMTYYAVRLRATANLIYWPKSKFELKTYAAASPFGGYIGPSESIYSTKDLLLEQNNDCPVQGGLTVFSFATGQPITSCTGINPTMNARVKEMNDNLGFHDEKLQYMLASNFMSPQQKLEPSNLDKALEFALIPNPAEKNLFLIANDAGDVDPYPPGTRTHTHEDGGDPFNHYFHSNDANGPFLHHFWAPIIPPKNAARLNTEIQRVLSQLDASSKSGVPLPQTQQNRIDTIKKTIEESIQYYFQEVLYNNGADSPNGENGESLFIAGLADPLGIVRTASSATQPDITYHMTMPQHLRRSWVTDKDKKISDAGRVGYSVKFIRFKEISGKGMRYTTDSKGTTLTNTLINDSEMSVDQSFDALDH